jgi:hypothetical protein
VTKRSAVTAQSKDPYSRNQAQTPRFLPPHGTCGDSRPRLSGGAKLRSALSYENIFRIIIMQFIAAAHSFDVRSVKKTCDCAFAATSQWRSK